ncbi:membrane protein [Bradyrhizobium sp. Tv2a-2]|uniref:lipopolysaccharide biosynthesis protein n=1 Tax=Bradyrhizobium sp. Tv2a-2 TaxID=113395 RepID=UPI000404EEBD|nr:membrane protein [Bradyrhizobium sp. Tv2a-2]
MGKTKPSLVRRLAIGLVGQGLWRVAVALNAVLLVPTLIAHWGVQGYGQWMTISAIVSCLGYATLGLVSTVINDIIMAVASQNQARAQRSFQMSCNLALGPFPILLAALVAALSILPLSVWFNLTDFSRLDLALILGFGALQLNFETLRGIMASILYSRGNYGLSYNSAAGAKLLELVSAISAVALLNARPVYLAALMAGFSCLDLFIVTLMARAAAPWARLNPRLMDAEWLLRQLKPGLGFNCYNFATQGVLVQGPRLVLGMLLGGSAVAVYAVYATAMRLVDQLFIALIAPAGVEISHAAGRGEGEQLVRLIAIVAQLSVLAFLGVSVFLMALGPIIFEWWTHDRIAFHHGFMALYLAMSAAYLPGRVAAQVLISLNAMRSAALGGLAIACLSLVVGAAFVPMLGLPAVLFAGIFGEIASSALMLSYLKRRLDLPLDHLARQVANVSGSAAVVWTHARAMLRR